MRSHRLPLLTVVLLGLSVFLAGCAPDGDNGSLTPQPTASVPVQQQAVESVLQLYRQAVLEEDIDRLQALLQPTALAQVQGRTATSLEAQSFRQLLSESFRAHTLTALTLPPDAIQIAADQRSVTFLEVESRQHPVTQAQVTRVFRTTFMLTQTQSSTGTVTLRISQVQRDGPLVTMTTPGQVQVGALTRLVITETEALFPLASGEVSDGITRALHATDTGFHGAFVAAAGTRSVEVRLRAVNGQELVVPHAYRLRQPDEGAVQRIGGTGTTRFFAVAVSPDGTVWAGGDAGARLYQVAPGEDVAQVVGALSVESRGRVEDLILDTLGRVHAVVVGERHAGVVVRDQGVGCQTVDVLAAAYPLLTLAGQPSPSTRAISAGSGDIWLHGSDAGIARVSDAFRAGQCPADGVHYAPVLRRDAGGLPSNTVPAMLVSRDGALWIGSALGLARIDNGQVTHVPFDPALSFQGNPETLEAFFQAVAQAIFAAQPLETVAVGEVSFIEAFGQALVKEDLIFSLLEDQQGRVWVGTLGGGIRRVEIRDGVLEETLHLTRGDGLASNIIFALAAGPDGSIWAATDDGVSRIQKVNGDTVITTFTAVDGLALPARDLAVDGDGTVWVATDGGLFRIEAQGGQITGVVQDDAGTPVEGVDVLVLGTSLRGVTDAAGQFVIANVPLGAQRLQVDGGLAAQGPLSVALHDVVVTRGTPELAPVVLTRGAVQIPVDVTQGGQVAFPLVPGSLLTIPAAAIQFPEDTASEVTLRLLNPATVAVPVPQGFTAVAAAALAPNGVTFTTPVRLTLPNQGRLPAGQLVVLLHLNETTQQYEQVGLGRVSADGTVITTLSGGLPSFSTVVFAATAAEATKVFLVPVAGNNQRAQPGDVLPEPLVVRLEEQFGNPVVGEAVAVQITRGEGVVVEADTTTNAQGEAHVRVQAGASDTDLIVAVVAPALPEVRPAQFFAVIGAFDMPGDALDLVVAGDVVFIADVSNGGLQVLDVQDPTRPRSLDTLLTLLGIPTFPTSVARHGERLYVGTFVPEHLLVLDIRDPRAPDFAVDRDGDGVPDVVLGNVALPPDLGARTIAIVGQVLYTITASFTPGHVATLHVVDIARDTEPRFLSSVALPIQDPTGLAVAGGAAYVGARTAGVLVFDVHEPAALRLVGSVGDPNPADTLAVSVVAGPVVAGQFAYLLETQQDLRTRQATEHFVVLDVRNPLAPVRRGTTLLRGVTSESVLTTVGTRVAVAGSFAYVTRGALGLQAVDIRQPDAPRPVGVITTPSFALSVAAADRVLYVTDAIFGLQVIRAPGPVEPDTDGDGIIDFFDAFPTDPTEWQDTDRDRVGDNADPDADNDGLTNAEEAAATPPTNPFDPRLYPVTAPPPDTTTLIVDAASAAPVRARNGTPEAPYRNSTEALQVLRNGQAPQVHTLHLRPGLYAPSTTQDVFPLDFSGLAHLTLRGADRATTVLDAEFRNSVVVARGSRELVFEDLTITHGWLGLFVVGSRDIVIRRIDSTDHNRHGILAVATTGAVLEDNLVTSSRAISGIGIAGGAEVVMTRNVSRAHPLHGIQVLAGSRADMRDNVSEDNGLSGISIDLNSSATLTNTVTQGNALDGLTISRNASATLTDTVSQDNGRDGIAIVDSSEATIHGGSITQNGGDGMRVGGGTLLPGRSTVSIGLDDDVLLELSHNDGAGLFVVNDGFGSEAQIDRRQIVFSNNAEGDTMGNICDVAAGPC